MSSYLDLCKLSEDRIVIGMMAAGFNEEIARKIASDHMADLAALAHANKVDLRQVMLRMLPPDLRESEAVKLVAGALHELQILGVSESDARRMITDHLAGE